jgi:hypothetical protein
MGDAFINTINLYKENGAENIVDVLNYNGSYLVCPIVTGATAFWQLLMSLAVFYKLFAK